MRIANAGAVTELISDALSRRQKWCSSVSTRSGPINVCERVMWRRTRFIINKHNGTDIYVDWAAESQKEGSALYCVSARRPCQPGRKVIITIYWVECATSYANVHKISYIDDGLWKIAARINYFIWNSTHIHMHTQTHIIGTVKRTCGCYLCMRTGCGCASPRCWFKCAVTIIWSWVCVCVCHNFRFDINRTDPRFRLNPSNPAGAEQTVDDL